MAPPGIPSPGKPPTARQIYALAAALCAFTDQRWPETRAEASDLIERLRIDIGHPAPALEDTPILPRPRTRRRRRRGDPASWERIALAKETMAALAGQLDEAIAQQRAQAPAPVSRELDRLPVTHEERSGAEAAAPTAPAERGSARPALRALRRSDPAQR